MSILGMPAVSVVADPGTPEWWRDRLLARLRRRQVRYLVLDRYYRGLHDWPWMTDALKEEFGNILAMTVTNYMGLVVDAPCQRIRVDGFRMDDAGLEQEAWRIWQANSLDVFSEMAFREALKSGVAFWSVAPGADKATPVVSVEHPTQVIVEREPGDYRVRRAAFKLWMDDATNLEHATLYLPDAIHKWSRGGTTPGYWGPRDGGDEVSPNPFGEVPIVEMPNRPDMLGGFASEIEDVIPIQDRINKTIADRLVTQDYGAFPQRYANNYPLDEQEDGPPDPYGRKPLLPPQLDIGRSRLLVSTTNSGFGNFMPAPLDPYSNAKNEDVHDIAARTQTPPHYLLGSLVNLSAEALKAAEAGLVAKVRERHRSYSDALEDVIRLALRAAGHDVSDTATAETRWADPETPTVAQKADAAVKLVTAGVISREQAQEDIGYSPQQQDRMRDDLARQMQAALNTDLASAILRPPPEAGTPGAVPAG